VSCKAFAEAVSGCNQFFVFVFMFELIVKLLAIGHLFFLDGWNQVSQRLPVVSVVASVVASGLDPCSA
jgi:hypothetical protein